MHGTTSSPSEAAGPSADRTGIVDLLANGKRVGVTADSHRVHPDICEFTTEQLYEWRPRAQLELRRQTVAAPGPLAGHGLRLIPVVACPQHERLRRGGPCVAGRSVSCSTPTPPGSTGGVPRQRLTLDDVLVVAPYNPPTEMARRPTSTPTTWRSCYMSQVTLISLTYDETEDNTGPDECELRIWADAACQRLMISLPRRLAPNG